MRTPAVLLLAACSGSVSGLPSTCQQDCELPKSLTLAATIEPPADSSLVRHEFPTDEIFLGADGVLSFSFPDSVETTFFVHEEGKAEAVVASQVLLTRASRISGHPDVSTVLQVLPGSGTAVARINADASYDIVVTPDAPDDERYLRSVLHGVTPSATLDLPLLAPQSAIEGVLDSLGGLDVRVRLQATRDGTDERTTIARALPGEKFALRALDVVGTWRVDAAVTFANPVDSESTLSGLTLDLSALVSCEAAPCVLSLPSVPTDIAQSPKQYTVVVSGMDAAGVELRIPGVRVELRAAVPVTDLESATITSESVTQADGTATVYLLDGYDYEATLFAGGSGFASTTATVPVPKSATAGQIAFDLELGPRLAGTVVAAYPSGDQAGVAGVVVSPQPSPDLESSTLRPGGATAPPVTDDSGAFSLRVDPGVYDLELTPPNGSVYPRWSFDSVEAFEETSGLQVVLPEGVPIPVVVRAGGEAVAGAAIRILVLSDDDSRPPRERALAMTDDLGAATVLLPNP